MDKGVKRVALVTGANRGLGLAICRALAVSGLHVVVTSRNAQDAEAAADELSSDALTVSAHQLDVTDPASILRATADITYDFGRLDVLINNAGVAIDRRQAPSAPDMERVQATLNVNLFGAWRCCAAVVPDMKKNGYGRIVNVTSHLASLSTMDTSSSPAYRVSKTSLNALTRILAAELKESNILVNAASPGVVDTRLAYGKADRTPDEAVETFVWLATLPDDGPTGQLFHDRSPLDW